MFCFKGKAQQWSDKDKFSKTNIQLKQIKASNKSYDEVIFSQPPNIKLIMNKN